MTTAIALRFTVPGTPQGKGRARSTIRKSKSGKSFVGHYTPAKTRSYEQQVAAAALEAMASGSGGAHWPARGVVEITLDIVMPIPASWPAWKREMARWAGIAPTTKPDIDNVSKAVFDGLNGIAWVDDAQVVDAHTRKRYATDEGDVGVHVIVAVAAVYPAQITKRPV